eukprot:186949-Pyramimonas_sp.AAC.1
MAYFVPRRAPSPGQGGNHPDIDDCDYNDYDRAWRVFVLRGARLPCVARGRGARCVQYGARAMARGVLRG